MESTQDKKIHFQEWVIDQVPESVVILLVGKRGSGKTTLLMDMLYHMRGRFDTGLAVAPTKTTEKTFRTCMCDSLIYDNMDAADAVISALTDLQGVFADDDHVRPRKLYFIADDCMYDKKAFRTETIKKILFNGRHYSITFICTAQYIMTADTNMRSQIDYVIVVGEPTPDTRDKLWEIFFKSVFDNTKEGKKLFYLTLKRLTSDHRCLVLDNKTTDQGLSNKIFWYKAQRTEDLPRFHLNKAAYRRMHKDTYIPIHTRNHKIKQEFLAKSMRRVAGNENIIELKKAPRGRGRGGITARGGRGGTVVSRRAPSARPKLAAKYHPEDDIRTNVTYTNKTAHTSRKSRAGSMSTFVPPSMIKCRSGMCGLPDKKTYK